jgi:hypothetical protein
MRASLIVKLLFPDTIRFLFFSNRQKPFFGYNNPVMMLTFSKIKHSIEAACFGSSSFFLSLSGIILEKYFLTAYITSY